MSKQHKIISIAIVAVLACVGIASAETCVPIDILNNLTTNTSVNITSVIVKLCEKIDLLNSSYQNLSTNYNNLTVNYNGLNSRYTSLAANISSNTSVVVVGNCTYMYSNINRTYFDNKLSSYDSSISSMTATVNNFPNSYVKLVDYSAYSASTDARISGLNSKVDTVNSSFSGLDEKIPNDYNAYFMIGFIILLIVMAAVVFIK